MKEDFVDKLRDAAGKLGIMLSDSQIDQFYDYFLLLTDWNQVMNLTAITEMNEVIGKHFLDSLSLVYALNGIRECTGKMIDVGTGAGFPGIPLKIAFPGIKITLLDSLNKRVMFLNTVIDKLRLTDICAVHGRAEDFGRNTAYREQFDYCVSRAVANTATLSEYCLPFVKVGGFFLPYKSGKIDEELAAGRKAIETLGGSVDNVVHFQLEEIEAERAIVLIRKVKPIGKKYPRKAGFPSREPIK